MPSVKLTARNLRTLKPHADVTKRATYRDSVCPGLYLDVFASGIRTFGVWYRVKGTRRAGRLTLGRLQEGVYDLADAREDAREVLHFARKGTDPAEKKRQDRESGTLGDLARSFLSDIKGKVRPVTYEGWRRIVGHDDLRPLMSRRPCEIERRDIIRLLDKIAARAPYVANRNFEVIRRMYRWAMSKDLVKASPCVGIVKPTKETPRSRSYTDVEVRAVLAALPGQGMMGDAVSLVFLTGVRIQQALGAPWSEFDLGRRQWLIPGWRTGVKNGLDWLVPLSDSCLALLERLKAETGECPWVFPVRQRKGATAGHAWRQQRVIYAVREASGVRDFSPHDVRRTLITWLAAQRVPKEVRDSVLGHKPPRLEGTYNVYEYLPEKRRALDRWAQHLERLMTGRVEQKVVGLARGI